MEIVCESCATSHPCHFMKKKGNKKMPRPRQEIIDNPIPISLFMCYAAVLLFVGTRDAILRILVNMYIHYWKTKM